MYPEIEDSDKVSMKKIEEFEKKYSISLPQDYKNFLSKTNGCYIDSKWFYKCKNENLSGFRLEALDEIDIGIYGDLEIFNSEPMNEDYPAPHIYFIKKVLYIGSIDAWDYSLYLCYEGENKGKLYKVDEPHDFEFFLIANSFDEFINGFEIDPDYEEK